MVGIRREFQLVDGGFRGDSPASAVVWQFVGAGTAITSASGF